MASGKSDGFVYVQPRQELQRRQAGVGYLMVLFAVAVIGLSLASAGEIIHTQSVREKETQLLFIGQQFRSALASYRDRTPVGAPNAVLRAFTAGQQASPCEPLLAKLILHLSAGLATTNGFLLQMPPAERLTLNHKERLHYEYFKNIGAFERERPGAFADRI
jgi:hypothetical protein